MAKTVKGGRTSRPIPKNPAVAAAVRLIVQELGKKNISKAALKTIYKAADKGASQVVRATDKAGAQLGMAKQGGRRAVQQMRKQNQEVFRKIDSAKTVAKNAAREGNTKLQKQAAAKLKNLRNQIK